MTDNEEEQNANNAAAAVRQDPQPRPIEGYDMPSTRIDLRFRFLRFKARTIR